MHSTNYYNTLIEIAEDCPTTTGEVPPVRAKKSVANMQYDYLHDAPYQYTSDDILSHIYVLRKGFMEDEFEAKKHEFFSKGQPCFRASPLTKRYGWGVHANAEGKIAIFAADSAEYAALVADDTVTKKKAMRSKRK